MKKSCHKSEIKILQHQCLYILACLAIIICGASVDMFVPSLPAIGHAFQAPNEKIGLIVTSYLAAYGLGQLFMGVVSDSFGRRLLLTISMFVFSMATFLIPLSQTMTILIGLRILQGISAAGIGVASRALLSDCYSGKMLAKRSTYYTFAWSIGPVLSPFLGGYLQVHFGWMASFYVLSIYAFIIAVLLIFLLIETSPVRHRFHLKIMIINYKKVLSSRLFLYATFVCGFSYGIITSINVAGPFLIEIILKYGPIVYGHIALFLGLSWMFGNLACRFVIARKHATLFFASISLFSIIIAVSSLTMSLVSELSFWSVTTPAILLMFCGGVLFPLGFGRCLSLFPKIVGTASAAMGAIYSVFAGTVSAISGFMSESTATNLSIVFLVSVLLITFSLWSLERGKRFIEKNAGSSVC